ncbi:MAG: serine/threonine-protein kinase [Gemmataceae bacterium]
MLDALLRQPRAVAGYCELLTALGGDRASTRSTTIDAAQRHALLTDGPRSETVTVDTLLALLSSPALLRAIHHDLVGASRAPTTPQPLSTETIHAASETTVQEAPYVEGYEAAASAALEPSYAPVSEYHVELSHDEAVQIAALGESTAVAVIDGPGQPDWIGRYQIDRVLGEGGMGVVYRARDPELDRDVAIKVHRCLDGRAEVRRRSRERFRRGVRAAALVPPHPNICPVHDVGDHGDEPFAVLEYVQGRPLDQVLGDRPLDPRRAVEIACKLASALETLHRGNIVHRDIKPANVLFDDRSGEPLLTDFGLAYLANDPTPVTIEGTPLGTPYYWSPEQALGCAGQVGPWSDTYSLGVVLYQMLTGGPTWTDPITVPGDAALTARLRKATATDPQARYRTGGEMADDLNKWLRGVQTPERAEPGPRRVFLRMLPKTGRHFVGRDCELRVLDAAWNDRRTYLVTLVAPGGAGKSSLLNRWIGAMAQERFCGAELVYGWSFYRQGESQTTSDQFFAHALDWFGDPNPSAGSAEDKGDRLARLVVGRRALLILDGLETMQTGGDTEVARLRDPALAALLAGLAVENSGLCVITTRRRVRDLERFSGTTALAIELNHLPPRAGMQLLRELGVHGSDDGLCRASEEYGGHALALTLLGSYLARFCHGDVTRRHQVRLLHSGDEQAAHARRVMASYEEQFGDQPELAVLRLIGLFDRPVDRRELAALCAPPVIPGLTDALVGLSEAEWQAVLARLREAKLIAEVEAGLPGGIDAHVLVRQHFGGRLRDEAPAAWRAGHSRLYEHLRDLWQQAPGECPEYPRTVDEIKLLYSAVYHACQAGRHQEALTEVYWPRIQRKRIGYSTRKLGLFGLDLEMLSWFFEAEWDRPLPTLRDDWQVFLPSLAASRLRAVGRLTEAVRPVEASLQGYIRRDQPRWAAHEARHQSELHLLLGNLDRALAYAEQGVRLADRGGDGYQRYAERAVVGAALHHLGRTTEAVRAFEQAEAILRSIHPDIGVLYSLWGYRYCDLLLDLGCLEVVFQRSERMQRFWQQGLHERDPEGGLGLISSAVHALVLARARLLEAMANDRSGLPACRPLMEQALKELHTSGRLDAIPLGYLLRAAYSRVIGDLRGGFKDVREALTIAKRGRMKLYEADGHLESCRLYLAMGETERARASLAQADMLVADTGYHRRDKDVIELKEMVERER